jgi:4-amino-4-deoxy-L-arabinose transferase-like glycosyltransferase
MSEESASAGQGAGGALARLQAWARGLPRSPGFWAVALGALVFLPWLGASGLWDPWETHYAEVARRMVQDGDWLTPRWRSELFFSKPVLVFWMMAASFQVFGLEAWAARLPFALLAVLGVFLAYRTLARLHSPRAGLLGAAVLATSPFYYFIARQAITDMPFAVFLLGTLSCFALAAMEARPRTRDLVLMYVFAGLAALAKTPVGLAIPGAVGLGYLLLSGDWGLLRRLKLHWGIPLALAIAAPWYATMLALHKGNFFTEFFLRHNVERAFSGVHGDRGGFVYYLEQMGYGFFPWVALLPLTLGRLGTALARPGGVAAVRLGAPDAEPARRIRLDLFLAVWLGVTFAAFTLMVTKFHHYVFPALPPLAMLTALVMVEERWDGWRFLAPLGLVPLSMVANDLMTSPRHLTNLCTYAYDRPLPEDIYPRGLILGIALAIGAGLLAARWTPGRWLRRGLMAAGIVAALGVSYEYVARLGDTLSQEALFRTYEQVVRRDEAGRPLEKLFQYQMNWRGEVFYSHDTIVKLGNESQVRERFRPDERVFIISVRDAFSAIDRAVRQETGRHLHMLPGSNLRYALASNRLDPGMPDLSPLAQDLLREPPEDIQHPVQAAWADGIELLGFDVQPAEPASGQTLELSFYFRCTRQVARDWKVFVHVDLAGGDSHRLNGDHKPLEGMFPTHHWMPGDVIRDRVRIHVPRAHPAGRHLVYVGFYNESNDDERMRLLPGPPSDGANRLRAGVVDIR